MSYLIRKKFVQICFSSFFLKKLEKKRPVLPLRKFTNPLPLPIGLTWDFPQRLELGKLNQYTIFSNFSNDAVKKKIHFLVPIASQQHFPKILRFPQICYFLFWRNSASNDVILSALTFFTTFRLYV